MQENGKESWVLCPLAVFQPSWSVAESSGPQLGQGRGWVWATGAASGATYGQVCQAPECLEVTDEAGAQDPHHLAGPGSERPAVPSL